MTVTWTAFFATTSDTFGTLASPTKTQIATGSFPANPAIPRSSANISIPSGATTGIEIVFSVSALPSGQALNLVNCQLEPAVNTTTPEPTAFERLPISTVLALCQRYFWALTEGVGIEGSAGTAAQGFSGTVRFPVPMRTTPTVTATFSNATNAGGGTVINIGPGGFQPDFSANAAGFTAATYSAGNSASAEL
jgi:hypothetical protein